MTKEIMIKKIAYVLIFVILIAITLGASTYLQSFFYNLTDFLKSYVDSYPLMGRMIFLILAALSVILGPFSSAPLVPSATLIWGVSQTFCMVFIGWIIGNSLAYIIGRIFGYPLVARIANQSKLDHWIHVLRVRLNFSMLLLFRIVTPSETGYVFGILKYDFKKYLLLSILAELPFAIIVVFAGNALAWDHIQTFFIYIGLWCAVIGIGMYLFKKIFPAKK